MVLDLVNFGTRRCLRAVLDILKVFRFSQNQPDTSVSKASAIVCSFLLPVVRGVNGHGRQRRDMERSAGMKPLGFKVSCFSSDPSESRDAQENGGAVESPLLLAPFVGVLDYVARLRLM